MENNKHTPQKTNTKTQKLKQCKKYKNIKTNNLKSR